MVCCKEASTGEIIAISPNQIVLPKFHGGTKMLYYIPKTPLSTWTVEGESGYKTKDGHAAIVYLYLSCVRAMNTVQSLLRDIGRCCKEVPSNLDTSVKCTLSYWLAHYKHIPCLHSAFDGSVAQCGSNSLMANVWPHAIAMD